MIAIAAGILVFVGVGLGMVLSRRRDSAPEVDPEAAYKTAVELHRIRRRLDVALIRSEQRRDAANLRRDIAEALRDDWK